MGTGCLYAGRGPIGIPDLSRELEKMGSGCKRPLTLTPSLLPLPKEVHTLMVTFATRDGP